MVVSVSGIKLLHPTGRRLDQGIELLNRGLAERGPWHGP